MNSTAIPTSYKNTLLNTDKSGNRKWIYPKKFIGKLTSYRNIIGYVLLAIFLVLPFLTWGGQPLFLFNFLERRFIIFHQIFGPTDFFLLVAVLLTFFFIIIATSVSFGRVWCGWLCPQTLVLETLFRPIEQWLEGNGHAQYIWNTQNEGVKYYVNKAIKHSVFIASSLTIAQILVRYIFGSKAFVYVLPDSSYAFSNYVWFFWLFLSAVIYFIFSFFREMACMFVCPYGRLQSVCSDKDSLVVAYDYQRNDCTNCKLCVKVCPMGIDIRNGNQLECLHCTYCIDVCDDIMLKINKPTGLIRYTSENSLKNNQNYNFTLKNRIFLGLSILILAVVSYKIYTRELVGFAVIKTPGIVNVNMKEGYFSNIYNVELINKSFSKVDVSLQSNVENGIIEYIGQSMPISLQSEENAKGTFILHVPKEKVKGGHLPVVFSINNSTKKLSETKSSFMIIGNHINDN